MWSDEHFDQTLDNLEVMGASVILVGLAEFIMALHLGLTFTHLKIGFHHRFCYWGTQTVTAAGFLFCFTFVKQANKSSADRYLPV